MKSPPPCSTYQLDRDRPQGRVDLSWHALGTDNPAVSSTPSLGASLFKGGYSGLGQVLEINRNEADRSGLLVAEPHRKARSGRYG
ncbi:MAG: hypothetical protein HC786_03025 [Richelia sp. CSU_2_1]|nr:hypothetical protein [Richelia sp. CSU_2_1]